MSSQRFQREMNDREAIEQDLMDGVDGLNGNVLSNRSWIKTVLDGSKSYDLLFEDNFSSLIRFLEENKEIIDEEKIDRFFQEKDPIKRLWLLKKMSLREALSCIRQKDFNENTYAWDYLRKRLELYENLTQSKQDEIAKWIQNKECDPTYYEAQIRDHAKSIKLGLERDILYAVMIGSPMLGAVKIATKRINEALQQKAERKGEEAKPIKNVVELFGYYSGIHEESIGQWENLATLYQRCLKEVGAKYPEKDEQTLEHKAVLLMSGHLENAYEYGGVLNTSASPYNPSFDESIVAGRLGHSVMRQLRGMRRKIQSTDLQNIHRFIGKSGDNPHVKKKRELEKELKNIHWKGESDPEVMALKEELDKVTAKYHRHASLAQKAIDLHFQMRGDDTIDWINNAPFGLINWTYNAIHRGGVSPKTAFAYAKATHFFPEEVTNRSLMEMVGHLEVSEVYRLPDIRRINSARGISATPEELCRLAKHDPHQYEKALDQGYTKEAILKHPWLIDENVIKLDHPFPFHGRPNQQEAWCTANAYYTPQGWNPKRIGQIMLARLDGGIDRNIHDASYWLQEFEVPEEKNNIVYKNPRKEIDLIYSAIGVPDHLKSRIPTKPNKYSELFSSEANELIYKNVLNFVQNGGFNFNDLKTAVAQELEGYKSDPKRAKSLKTPLPKLEEEVQRSLNDIHSLVTSMTEAMNVSTLVGELRQIGERRKNYIDTAQAWVLNNASAPRELLTFAWANRELALQDGCEDNPRAIKQWADLNSLRAAYINMEKVGRLPENLERGDMKTYSNWLAELVRCYDGETAIQTLSKLKDEFNPECEITPMKIDLGDGWTGEILKKNDPRGLTIGYDTGCCMTLGGASESCIHAGYSKAPYGFFALYRDDKLVAQSFLYTNPMTAPEVIVADNIEANQGRDMHLVLEKYNAFFKQYFATQLRRNNGEGFSALHVGEGYTSVGLNHLQEAPTVEMPDSGIYTDAHHQRILLNVPSSEAERLGKFKAERFKPLDWNEVKNDILKIEAEAFRGKGYDEAFLESLLTNPNNIAFVMRDGNRVVGYTVGEKLGDDTIYVMSTALAKNYQHQGLVSDMLCLMDEEARRQGCRYYEREAAVENGYAEKLIRNYNIVEKKGPFDSPFGKQMRLKMEIPDHRLPNSMKQEIEEVDPILSQIKFTKLSEYNLNTAVNLENKIYPQALQVGIEGLAQDLEFDDEERENASFIISEVGNNKAIGYAIAYMTESEIYEEDEVLYINDIAITPEHQRKGYGMDALKKLIHFSESRGNLPIEFHAREKTSYQAIIHSQTMLEKLGYQIVHDELIEDYFDEAEVGDRNVHLVRLEKVMQQKKAA